MSGDSKAGIQIGVRSFFTSALIIIALMLLSGILTRVVPQGGYARETTEGREVIVDGSFTYVDGSPLPVYRWFTAPVEVLFSDDAPTVIVIIFFIMSIGGAFAVLDKCGLLRAFILSVSQRYKNNKYRLLAALILCFMLFGSVIGLFEETVALAPIMIALSYALGWDSLVGIGMSALAAGFGFACAITNPFTCGIAQKLAGLPSFSGSLFRIIFFAVSYIILYIFVSRYAKRIEANPRDSLVYEEDAAQREKYSDGREEDLTDVDMMKAMRAFKITLLLSVIVIAAGIIFSAVSDLSLPLVAVTLAAGSLVSGRRAKRAAKVYKVFFEGIGGIAPGIVLILLAMSVKQIIVNGRIMDTILYYAATGMADKGPFAAVIMLYLLVLFMNFFIGSGSAKAFLIIPLVAPLADLVGITRQTAVQAFLLGDGLTNVIYPTNPVLMIMLGVTVVSYTKWFKWTIKLQLLMFVISAISLLTAVLIGYGPF